MKYSVLRFTCVCMALLTCFFGCGKKSEDTTSSESQTNIGSVTSKITEQAEQTQQHEDTTLISSVQTDTQTNVSPAVTEEPAEYGDGWTVATMQEQILASNKEWSVAGKPVYKDGYMGSESANTAFDITCLTTIGPEEIYRFEFELNTPKIEDASDDSAASTLFVGLRIESDWGVADENNGLWLSFKDSVMGVKTVSEADWEEGISEYALPYDFNNGFRRVCVVDNRVENAVDVYQSNDEGKNSLVYKLKIVTENGKSYVYIYGYYDNFETVVDIAELGFDITPYDTGYVKLWNHNRGGVYIKNLAMKVI